jgi:DnaJ-class molecular chaperone
MATDYWKDCISEAFEDAGLTATEEQIACVAGWVEGAHDNYGMAHGHDCIPNPLRQENDRLKDELKAERRKVVCPECKGSGRIICDVGFRSSESECSRCRGEGKV